MAKITTANEMSQWLGYLSLDEVAFLKKVASKMTDYAVFVNIGAGAGTSGLAMREANANAQLYTIDISPGGPLGGLSGERTLFNRAQKELPIQILADSKEYGKDWPKDRQIDLLFIDGDHTDVGVTGDIKAWLPHVKSGGNILLHDYGSNDWPHVKAVADKLLADQIDGECVDTLKAYIVR
jgi:predicted O-methyltransferase YrrM